MEEREDIGVMEGKTIGRWNGMQPRLCIRATCGRDGVGARNPRPTPSGGVVWCVMCMHTPYKLDFTCTRTCVCTRLADVLKSRYSYIHPALGL